MKLRVRPTGKALRTLIIVAFATVVVVIAPNTAPADPRDDAVRSAFPFQVIGPRTWNDVNAIAQTGAAVDGVEHGRVQITVRRGHRAVFTSAARTAISPSPNLGVQESR